MQQKVKHRLTGIFVIALIALLCLPMIFYQKLPAMRQAATVSDTNSGAVMREVIYDLPIKAQRSEEVVKPVIKPVTKTEPELPPVPHKKQIPKKVSIISSLPDAWTLQVASFSDPENAKHLLNHLRHKDLLAYTQLRGKVTQVFVGPYIDRHQVQRLQLRLEQEMHLNTIIRKYQR